MFERKVFRLMVVVMVICIFILTTVNNRTYKFIPKPNLRRSDVKHLECTREKYQIVIYKPVQWHMQGQVQNLNMTSCTWNNCDVFVMTYRTDGPIEADAVIFQGNKMVETRPRRLHSYQVFVFFNNEPPYNAHDKTSVKIMDENDNYFNWTITYKRDSDIWAPYGVILPKSLDKDVYFKQAQLGTRFKVQNIPTFNTEVIERKNYSQIYQYKTRNVLWFVSHCFTSSRREKYVERMKNVTSIKVFGKCGVSRVNGNVSFEQKYKFYLAFENCLCEDYITEKVYHWYTKDIILVVRGGANYSENLPEGTYVNAADFRTPEDLADFLNKLGSDEERYIEYLRRKDNYQVFTEQENVQAAFCELCWRLNNKERFRKSHVNISSWWFGSCRSGNV